MKAISDGVGLALDPAGGKSALTIAGGDEKRRVKLECPHGRHLRMEIETERTGVNVRMGASSHLLGPGSVVRTRYAFTIGTDQMNRFLKRTELDAFDGTEAEEVASAPGNVPDRARRVAGILGENYVVGDSSNAVSVNFVMN